MGPAVSPVRPAAGAPAGLPGNGTGGRTAPLALAASGDFLGLLAAVLAGLLRPVGEAADPEKAASAPGGGEAPALVRGLNLAGNLPTPRPAGADGDLPAGEAAGPAPQAVGFTGLRPRRPTPEAVPARPEASGRALPGDPGTPRPVQADQGPGRPPARGQVPAEFKGPGSDGIPANGRAEPGPAGASGSGGEAASASPTPPTVSGASVPPAKPPMGPARPVVSPAAGRGEVPDRPGRPEAEPPVGERPAALPGLGGTFVPRPEGRAPAADGPTAPAPTPGALAEQAGVLAARLGREGSGQAVFWLRLEPPELGRVELKIRLRPEGSFEVELRPRTAAAYNLLAGALDGLKEALAGRGMVLAGLAVFDPWGGVHDREPRGGRGRALRPPGGADAGGKAALVPAVGVPAGSEPEAVGPTPGRFIDRKA
mgnify:CR=1 FL=1